MVLDSPVLWESHNDDRSLTNDICLSLESSSFVNWHYDWGIAGE